MPFHSTLQAGPRQEPMAVTRIFTATGSHIEPELDQAWTQSRKLEWHAAVVAHDTGLTIRVHTHVVDRHGGLAYSITIGEINQGGQRSLPARPYYDAWDALSLIRIGAGALLDQQRGQR